MFPLSTRAVINIFLTYCLSTKAFNGHCRSVIVLIMGLNYFSNVSIEGEKIIIDQLRKKKSSSNSQPDLSRNIGLICK